MTRWCKLLGHRWAKLSGFHHYVAFGTYCLRCGKQAETYEEFRQRTGR